MALDLFTLCGRYGKNSGEPFLRRRGTLEPLETPRRYFASDAEYQDGKTASAAAWKEWNRTRLGALQTSTSSFFELLDDDLKEINRLIQSGDDASFDRGVKKLQGRVIAAKDASWELDPAVSARTERTISRSAWKYYQDMIRKGPPIIEHILEQLQIPSKREKAKQLLTQLCDDDEEVARTFGKAPIQSPSYHSPSHHTISTSSSKTENYAPSSPPTRQAQTTTGMAATSRPEQQTNHPTGETFRLGHDPGERQGATVIQGNMSEKSIVPTRRPEPSFRTTDTNPSPIKRRNIGYKQTTQHLQALPSTKYETSTSQPEKKTNIHPKGEAFGLGHDPGELKGVTVAQEGMYAESTTPNHKPNITSRPKTQRTYRRASDERPSESNPPLPSNVKTHDFAYEGA